MCVCERTQLLKTSRQVSLKLTGANLVCVNINFAAVCVVSECVTCNQSSACNNVSIFTVCSELQFTAVCVFLICSLNQSRACNNVCVCTAFCRVAAFYSFCLCIIVFITSTYEMQFFTGLCSRASVF